MTVEELAQDTEEKLPELAKVWLAPVDRYIGDLMASAEILEPDQFFGEVTRALTELPNLYGQMDKDALQDALEDAQGEAMAIPLEETPELTGDGGS